MASASRSRQPGERLANAGLAALSVAILVLAFVAFGSEGLERSPSGGPKPPAERTPQQILLSLGDPRRQDQERGERIYRVHCQPCHGQDGNLGLAGARRFGLEPFRNTAFGPGAHPVSLFDTLTHGFRKMVPQNHLSVADRIAVIRHLRERLVRNTNPGEYLGLEDLLARRADPRSDR